MDVLRISHAAHHQIQRLPASTQERVNAAIATLADNPRSRGTKKLAAGDGYRIRVGDYRVLYRVDDGARTVTVLSVKSWGDAHRP